MQDCVQRWPGQTRGHPIGEEICPEFLRQRLTFAKRSKVRLSPVILRQMRTHMSLGLAHLGGKRNGWRFARVGIDPGVRARFGQRTAGRPGAGAHKVSKSG